MTVNHTGLYKPHFLLCWFSTIKCMYIYNVETKERKVEFFDIEVWNVWSLRSRGRLFLEFSPSWEKGKICVLRWCFFEINPSCVLESHLTSIFRMADLQSITMKITLNTSWTFFNLNSFEQELEIDRQKNELCG